jgi:hypothetical protein
LVRGSMTNGMHVRECEWRASYDKEAALHDVPSGAQSWGMLRPT